MFRNSYIAELIHDISFAVFRVSALVEHAFLRKELERYAVELSAYIDEEAIYGLERLIVLSKSIGEITEVNAEVLLRELGSLRELLNEEDSEEAVEADISNLFRKESQELPFKTEKVNGKKVKANETPSKRQTEILNYIRQFPDGCRMAELASNFEEVSKRTLRNDVSALIKRDLIERVGSRGPYSYLKVVDSDSKGSDIKEDLGAEEGRVIFLSEPQSEPKIDGFDRLI